MARKVSEPKLSVGNNRRPRSRIQSFDQSLQFPIILVAAGWRIEVFDETALRRHLEALGVAPGDVHQRYGAEGDGPSMYIQDPEGNTVELKGPPSG